MRRRTVLQLVALLVAAPGSARLLGDPATSDDPYARLQAEEAATTQPAAISNAELAKLQSELTSLRAENATLRARLAEVAPTPASTQPAALASIVGNWEEAPGVDFAITQTGASWKAHCTYVLPTFGEVQWEMVGSLSPDGTLKGVLHHKKAPKGYSQLQIREARLSPDGTVISGRAQWDGSWHPFTWTKIGSAALAASKKWKPEKNLKVGMSEAEADATMKAGSAPFVFIREDDEVSATGKVVSWSRLDNSPRYADGGRVDSDTTHYHMCTITFTDGRITDIQY